MSCLPLLLSAAPVAALVALWGSSVLPEPSSPVRVIQVELSRGVALPCPALTTTQLKRN